MQGGGREGRGNNPPSKRLFQTSFHTSSNNSFMFKITIRNRIQLSSDPDRIIKPFAYQGRRVCSVVPPCLLIFAVFTRKKEAALVRDNGRDPPPAILSTSNNLKPWIYFHRWNLPQKGSAGEFNQSKCSRGTLRVSTLLSRLAAGWFTTPTWTILFFCIQIETSF